MPVRPAAALRSVKSFHIEGTQARGTETVTADVAGSQELRLDLKQRDAKARMVFVDGAVYMNANASFWRKAEAGQDAKELDGRSRVYAGSARGTGEQTLRRGATLKLSFGGLATAGDVSGDGRTVAVRTYGGLLVWTRRPGVSLAATLKRAPCVGQVSFVREGQGESLALSRDGRSLFTIPEGGGYQKHPAARPAANAGPL